MNDILAHTDALIFVILAWGLSAMCSICVYQGQEVVKSKPLGLTLVIIALAFGPFVTLPGFVLWMLYIIVSTFWTLARQADPPTVS